MDSQVSINNIGEIFHRYKKAAEVFIETGTHEGGSTVQALALGFDTCYSIELHEPFYDACVKKFAGNPKVNLTLGSSAEHLSSILSEIDGECLFWLDAHDSFGHGVPVPIDGELQAIKNHSIKSHTIIIDDIPVLFGDGSELRSKILDINPEYRFDMIDPGYPSRPGYIMVAYIMDLRF